jgi:hypothetical protein
LLIAGFVNDYTLREQLRSMSNQAKAALPGMREVVVEVDDQLASVSGLLGQRLIPGVYQPLQDCSIWTNPVADHCAGRALPLIAL